MNPERDRIQADLRGLLRGDVDCSDLYSQLYASDASVYEIKPLGVVRPRHTEDVVQLVKYAADNSIPLFPRGAGTGLAGQALGPGLVIDFSRFLRRLVHLDVENQLVRVQPGMVLADLNRMLANEGLLFGPDPATRSVTTMGSVIAVDTSGSHWPRYGSAASVVESLSVVLPNGEQARLGKHSWKDPFQPTDTVGRIANEVGQLLYANASVIEKTPWRGVARGCGYRLESAIEGDMVNLAKLQAGAEGTLAIITEATVRLERIPVARGVVLLFFDRLETAARAAVEAQKHNVAACDLMDRRLLEIARETDARYDHILPRGAEAMLLIEQQGDEIADVRNRMMSLINKIQRRSPSSGSSRITFDAQERALYWTLCRKVVPRLYRLKGSSRPLPFVDDIAVAPVRLPDFLIEIQNILKAERVTATLFAHASHGQIHIRPFLDVANPDDVAKMQRLSDRLYEKVIEFDGVIAGEHAVGISRSWFARQQLGDRYPICRRIKELFDPNGILNPGKLVTDAPQRVNENLRPIEDQLRLVRPIANNRNAENAAVVDSPSAETIEASTTAVTEGTEVVAPTRLTFLPILKWDEANDVSQVARSCNGCGRCRTTNPAERMCPMFRIGFGEEASPRSKSNAMRGLLSGQLPAASIASDEMKKLADLCFQCHQCRLECPASVDIPKLVTEIKAQYVATQGLEWNELILSRLDLLASMASRFPKIANWGLENQQVRWLLEKATGIAQGRRLPSIASQPFHRWAARQRLHRPKRSGGKKVLFFVDQYASWHNPLLGKAMVHVLKHQRIDVFVPSYPTISWMSKIAMGDVVRARKLIQPMIKKLAESVRQGYEIVTTEPSAALALQHEYLQLFDDEDTKLVSKHTWEAGRYLLNLHNANELELNFTPQTISVLYHQPCHLRAIDPEQPGFQLLKLIPGINVQSADAGCSGMAGTYGLRRENYRTSLRIGWGLVSKLQQTSAQVGSTECTACKLQMEQGVDKPTIHPIALLAYAYGLVPEVGNWIQRRNEGLTVL
jgi:FAD/FMN-containing dehydrogenase/Fe-S oxidoreductase